jgi:hypothetical protein
MYELTLEPPTPNALAARSHNRPTDLETWHCRLGHVGEDAIKLLNSKSLVDGLVITSKETSGACEDCIFGKQTQHPFDKEVTPETEVLERVHMDLWGPAHVMSMGGKQYMLLAIDGGSSHGEGYFLAEKTAENCVNILAHFHVTAEHQTGKLLKIICTDEEKEWVKQLVDGIVRSLVSSTKQRLLTHCPRMVFPSVVTELSWTESEPFYMMQNSLGHTGLKLLQRLCAFEIPSQVLATQAPSPMSCGTRRNRTSRTFEHLVALCMQKSLRMLF